MQKGITYSYNRVELFDIARGIAILLVIAGHILMPYIEGGGHIWRNYIYSFHMPFFFILAGLTSAYHEREKIKRINVSLMISYFFWSIVLLLYKIIVYAVLETRDRSIVLIKGFFDTISFAGIGALWFIPTLILVNVIIYQMNKHVKKWTLLFVLTVLFLMTILLSNHSICNMEEETYQELCIKNIILVLIRPLSMSFFAAVGYIAKDRFILFLKTTPNAIRITACILALGLTYILSLINGYVDVHYMIFGKNVLIFICTSLLGTVGLLIFSDVLQNSLVKKFFMLFGINSLFVMATHGGLSIMGICKRLVEYMKIQNNCISFLLEFLFVLLIETLLIFLIGKKIREQNKHMVNDLLLK